MVNASYPPVSSSSTPVSDIDLYSDEVLADPYPAFRVIRGTGPAVQLTAHPVWVIARYADVRAALRDWRTFTSAEGVAMTDEMNAHMHGSVLASDPPEHGVLRGVLGEKLAPRALAKLSDEIGGRADAIVAEAVAKETFDALTDPCARLPLEAVADLIGLPPERRERLLPGSDAVFATFGPLDARIPVRMPAFQGYFEYMMSFIDPSKLAQGSGGAAIWDAVDDGRIGPEFAFPLLTAYLVAALDTTVYALGSYVQFLAGAPQR
jgi:cytochrome P450